MGGLKDAFIAFLIGFFRVPDEILSSATQGLRFVNGTGTFMGVPIGTPGIAGSVHLLASSILSLALLLEIVTLLTKTDILRFESVLLLVGKYMVCAGIVSATPDILAVILEEGTNLITSSTAMSFETYSNALARGLADAGVFQIIGITVAMLPIVLILILLAGVIALMVGARAIEIMILTIFAPIPMALLPYSEGGSGFNPTSVRFLKYFIAVVLSGAMIMGVIGICGNMLTAAAIGTANTTFSFDHIGSFLLFLTSGVLIVALCAIAVTKCSQWAKSLMGV